MSQWRLEASDERIAAVIAEAIRRFTDHVIAGDVDRAEDEARLAFAYGTLEPEIAQQVAADV